jgi:hypothetical protein
LKIVLVMRMETCTFWYITPCTRWKSTEVAENMSLCLLSDSYWFLAWLLLLPCIWGQFPPKRPLTFSKLHSVMCQNIRLLFNYFVVQIVDFNWAGDKSTPCIFPTEVFEAKSTVAPVWTLSVPLSPPTALETFPL